MKHYVINLFDHDATTGRVSPVTEHIVIFCAEDEANLHRLAEEAMRVYGRSGYEIFELITTPVGPGPVGKVIARLVAPIFAWLDRRKECEE